jgi:Homeodomain-like domain
MRVARPIVLSPESRNQWERQVPGRNAPVRLALRSRIVLLAAEGKQHKQISEELKTSPRMAALWRGRFLLRGVEGFDEGCSAARAHAVDCSGDGRHSDQKDYPDHSSQRDSLVHAHHGA